MTPRDDNALLLDIVAFVAGMDFPAFQSDAKTQAAVQHRMMLIGEAAKRLSDESRQKYSTIPWAPMARMRDRLIHGYASVDIEVVWTTATKSIPNLLATLKDQIDDEY